VFAARGARIEVLPDRDLFVGMIHRANTDPKRPRDTRWRRCPIETVEAVMRTRPMAGAATAARPAALVTAAAGIGDIIRVTPLVRVLHRLGHDVDLLLAPDDPATASLFEGAPELRRVIVCPPIRRDRRPALPPELAQADYAHATFTTWSAPLARVVPARHHHAFEQAEWLAQGDSRSVETIARALGWTEALPAPFVQASARRFDLPAGTVALHPGCKPGWPWKKWHGFDELARRFAHVAVVGTPSDLDNSRTYFKRSFDWPAHARNFVGKLSLADTAALIGQCAALVSNDSGLMHVSATLGVPTFGIFGITSPERELIPSPAMVAISKQLPCEADCRRKPWGRRDCERHLECLKTLSADEVAARILARLPHLEKPRLRPEVSAGPAPVRLNYYGNVFDASGYGQAARLYVHALHRAGVKVAVTDTGAQPPQVADELTASLLGHDDLADFNLFHGIPSAWARSARRLRNVIAMTVWETDGMPQQWREPLARAIDLWLPCRFNAEVFGRALAREAFTLPHALPPRMDDLAPLPLDIAAKDFVFYGIFEWQDRKNPHGLMQTFLHAFPQESDAVLVLKTGPGAAADAKAALQRLRAVTGARGRVVLCCEAWSDAQVAALHTRGDCYVSLHKGEGWGYPLFEAAARGKPAIATDYSGPRDYLDAQHHWLVRSRPAPVRQPYRFYRTTMNWAEPDLAHAAEGLRWVYDNRDAARARAAQAAERMAADFSLERVGALAKARLLHLLEHRRASKAALPGNGKPAIQSPAAPIPAAWFDAGYFEHGLKSNWREGYRWPLFEGVFRDTAAYLAEMFPGARSFLDIGCAKGFLVRTLRERGLDAWGFDHSAWAIAHADADARPFLQQADVAAAQYDRPFDVLVAMSVLESLSEDQIHAFLPRARPWARQALLAVIATPENSAHMAGRDRDLSRITLRDRQWWRRQFAAAGWRQDAACLALERQCRAHPLPRRMGWSIHVYSPQR
jgi:ADP-heptose:LPS heptosyltransferase/2-polyprenyl-3-methyl-5-hydroxy-6-metoxy-1,4-benzoquinol methylase